MLSLHIPLQLLLHYHWFIHGFQGEAHRFSLIRSRIEVRRELNQVDVAECTLTQLDNDLEIFKHVRILCLDELGGYFACRDGDGRGGLSSSDLVHLEFLIIGCCCEASSVDTTRAILSLWPLSFSLLRIWVNILRFVSQQHKFFQASVYILLGLEGFVVCRVWRCFYLIMLLLLFVLCLLKFRAVAILIFIHIPLLHLFYMFATLK